MKRSTDTRWSPAEIQQNQKEQYAAMAEHPPDRKASEKFHRPAYQAGKLIKGQNGWRRIQKRSVEALEMLRMRMKE